MAEEELRLSRSNIKEHDASPPGDSEATVDEGIRLLEAFRAISSPAVRDRILAIAATEAQRSARRPLH